MRQIILFLFVFLALQACKNPSKKRSQIIYQPSNITKVQWDHSIVIMSGNVGEMSALLELTVDGDTCFGSINYKKIGKPILIAGNIRHDVAIDERVQLKQMDGDNSLTGSMRGTFIGNEFNGQLKLISKDTFPFTFTIIKIFPIKK